MDGLFTLLALAIVMAIASFLAGSLPLSFSLSTSQLRLVSTIGMGVLVGTSLIVIIPEGVETLYNAQSTGASHSRRHLVARSQVNVYGSVATTNWIERRKSIDTDAFNLPGPVIPEGINVDPPKTPTEPGAIGALGNAADDVDSQDSDEAKHDADHHGSPHAWIGVALITGFILMFLIDKLPHHVHVSKPTQQRYHIALNDLGRRFQRSATNAEEEDFLGSQSQSQQTRSFATTTGLVIHAAADGIALGASSSAADTGLSFIIFLAIMVHKAPAAFGLTSVLLKQGLSKRSTRGHLVLFSLAAPVGAILTWTLSQFISLGGLGDGQNRGWWTGMLLLFSGGTFLYVAMQTMQEVGSSHGDKHTNGHANGYLDRGDQQQPQQEPNLRDLMAAVFGMVLPLFLQIGHAH